MLIRFTNTKSFLVIACNMAFPFELEVKQNEINLLCGIASLEPCGTQSFSCSVGIIYTN